MDQQLLDAIDAAVLVVRRGAGAIALDVANRRGRALLGGCLPGEGGDLDALLPESWRLAIEQAARHGSARLPATTFTRAERVHGMVERVGADGSRLVATLVGAPASNQAEALEILDQLSEMVCRWRPDGTIYFCNTAYARQCGLGKDEVAGANLFNLTPADELPQILTNVRRLGPDRPTARYDHRIGDSGDRERWQEWIDQALFGTEGAIVGYQSTGRDITRRKLAEERLRRSEQRLQLALTAGRQRVWELNLRTGIGWVVPLADADPAEGAARPSLGRWIERLHEEDRERIAAELDRLARGEINRMVAEYRLSRSDGGYRWVLTHAVAMERDATGRADVIVGTSVDIDARRRFAAQLRESEQRLRLALEAAGLAVWEIDAVSRKLRIDRTGAARLGFGEGLVAMPLRATLRLIDSRDRHELLGRLRTHLQGRSGRLRGEFRLRQPNGGVRWIEAHGVVTAHGAEGRPARMIGVAADVTARKETELRLATLALEDHLTGLPNRRALDSTLERAIAHGLRTGERVGLLLLDLDGFKAVNDRLGHLAGDELLAESADRLRRTVRRSDVVARFGGDEFAIVAAGAKTRRQLSQLARRVMVTMSVPAQLGASTAQVRVSVGIAVFPEDGLTAVELLGRADAALYAAKRGRDGFRFAAELEVGGLELGAG